MQSAHPTLARPHRDTRTGALLLVLFGLGLSAPAWPDAGELSRFMPAGNWQIAYERKAAIKSLFYKKADKGTRQACIGSDPRGMILAWLADKQCSISGERLLGKTWHLDGDCRVKWSKQPIPIQVDILLGDGTSFVMDTRTAHGAFLDFQEHAKVTRIAARCGES